MSRYPYPYDGPGMPGPPHQGAGMGMGRAPPGMSGQMPPQMGGAGNGPARYGMAPQPGPPGGVRMPQLPPGARSPQQVVARGSNSVMLSSMGPGGAGPAPLPAPARSAPTGPGPMHSNVLQGGMGQPPMHPGARGRIPVPTRSASGNFPPGMPEGGGQAPMPDAGVSYPDPYMAMLKSSGSSGMPDGMGPMPTSSGAPGGRDSLPFDMTDFPSLTSSKGLSDDSGMLNGMGMGMPHDYASDYGRMAMSSTSSYGSAAMSMAGMGGPSAAAPSSNMGSSSTAGLGAGAAGPAEGSYSATVRRAQAAPGMMAPPSSAFPALAGAGGGPRGDKGEPKSLSPTMSGLSGHVESESYGLMGLLNVIRMTDRDTTMLALGIDLTTLGFNLSSPDCLYATFGSPFAAKPTTQEPHYTLPQCYRMPPLQLKAGLLSHVQPETLFYIFYAMPRDVLQVHAAKELYSRGWQYHREHRLWFVKREDQMQFFDINVWKKRFFSGDIPSLQSGFLTLDEISAPLR